MTSSERSTPSGSTEAGPARRRLTGWHPGHLLAVLFVVAGSWAALSIDVVRAGYGIKADEATYVAMAMSAAYDGDLRYERRDLERFWALYQGGPEGIFLKRGQRIRVAWPSLRIERTPEQQAPHLYYGKAFAYSVAAAPFVRLAGLNGLLIFHVWLLAAVLLAGYAFIAARSPAPVALLFSIAFVAASITPVYMVWLTPEVFNFSLVFLAGFLWLYKEVAPPAGGWWSRLLRGRRSDRLAAILLGVATFSKPSNVLLIGPLVLLLWWRRQYGAGLGVGVLFGAVVAGLFAVNGAITGEPNYQGGDRKTFYGSFPFENAEATFDNLGIDMATDEVSVEDVFAPDEFWPVFARNAGYFFAGRHFGFVPFFFPGMVALALCLWRWRDRQAWHVLILMAAGTTVLILLVWLPYSWSGGGGPAGNRYFLSVYPLFFFLMPPVQSAAPAIAAWVGGAAFTAHVLINPFVMAKDTWRITQRGLFRALPIELTMVNDLPVMLNTPRARLPYGREPTLLLYFLDERAFLPEAAGIWVGGRARTEIIVRTGEPLARVDLGLQAPIANTVTVAMGGARRTVRLDPGRVEVVSLAPRAVYSRRSYAYVLSIGAAEGFVPRLVEPGSRDGRHLGVLVSSIAASAGREAAR